MTGDISRSTHRPGNHYSSVRLQQGRVLLDADWNEQADLTRHVERVTGRDVIGPTGAPRSSDPAVSNFAVSLDETGTDLVIGPGRIHVDGIVCENDDPAGVRYTAQPDLPGAAVPTTDGSYAVYLDVWERQLSAVDQHGLAFPPLVDAALPGTDTATRTRVVWQVRLAPIPGLDCAAFQPPPAPTGRLRASEVHVTGPVNDCSVPAGGGYRRLENQLYRIEVHDTPVTGPVMKWSRDNASLVARVTALDEGALTITVDRPGHDDETGFASAAWVELSDEERILTGTAGALLPVASASGTTLVVTNPDGLSLATGTNPTLRRWDGVVALTAATPTELEDGVQVEIDEGTFAVGDHWLVPARTTTAKVEWPADPANPDQPAFEPRHGTAHHYCVLAVVDCTGGVFGSLSDCRRVFPPLTAITAVDVSYDPSACATLAGTATVQQALDVLCQGTPAGTEKAIHVKGVLTADGAEVRNDTVMHPEILASGLTIVCTEDVFPGSVITDTRFENPVCTVTLDLPWPTNPSDRDMWRVANFGFVGFTPLTLAAQVSAQGNMIMWNPAAEPPVDVKSWLAEVVLKIVQGQTHGQLMRLLCKLRLSGSFIWGPAEAPEIYLDGQLFGMPGGDHVDVAWPSGSGRRASNLEMWFWLGLE